MSDSFSVSSRFGDYTVRFADEFSEHLHDLEDSFVIADANVATMERWDIDGLVPEERRLLVEASETAKTLDSCREVIEAFLERGIRRNHELMAIGGGVIQDLTGFIATVLFRGVRWKFFPTTLLAQADSCIGGKTSINLGKFKNLLGSFYPPDEIFIDPQFLETLSETQVRSGIGEIMHFYLVGDSDHLEDLSGRYEEWLEAPSGLRPHIAESLRIKRDVIQRDELDRGERRLFNYGHTFGHAIETVTNFEVNHGQAVTLGMDIANFISMKLGMINEVQYHMMLKKIEKNIPDFVLPSSRMNEYLEALSRDKKNRQGMLGCILTRGPGQMKLKYLPFGGDLPDLIRMYFRHADSIA